MLSWGPSVLKASCEEDVELTIEKSWKTSPDGALDDKSDVGKGAMTSDEKKEKSSPAGRKEVWMVGRGSLCSDSIPERQTKMETSRSR